MPTMRAMNAEGRTFKGCLYFGLMLTEKGPKVIEYNCRFGDPEAQVVLPLLDTDLLTIMKAVTEERLSEVEVKWKDGSAVTQRKHWRSQHIQRRRRSQLRSRSTPSLNRNAPCRSRTGTESRYSPVFLPGESQGRGSVLGCRLWGHTELDTTEAT